MAKRNYGFEKRQKEIARKQKQDEKRLRRQDRSPDAPDEPGTDSPSVSDQEPSE